MYRTYCTYFSNKLTFTSGSSLESVFCEYCTLPPNIGLPITDGLHIHCSRNCSTILRHFVVVSPDGVS